MSRWEALVTDPRLRHAQQVTYSVQMVADIASGYDDAIDRGDMVVARCMLDAFYVHVRLLAEFFLHTTSTKDFGPTDFGIRWVAPTGSAPARLEEAWRVASTYVVHFGRPRVPESIEELRAFSVGGSYFRGLARDVIECYADFVRCVAAAAPVWEGGTLLPDPESEPDRWSARVSHDVVLLLNGARAEAHAKLRTGTGTV